MLQKFKKHIHIIFPFLKDKKLLIAISGGVDSVVLTHLLHQLNFDISLAHCNFQLRGKESDLDEEFVKKLGKELKTKVFTTQFNTLEFAKTTKQSTQIAARNLRYHWFQELQKKHQYDYVLTAHHADDNLETFLINLTRGTGLDGFTGIPTINRNIIRPLLAFSRNEILTFAKDTSTSLNVNIEWREDKSNLSTKYIRNKIRHQVLPVLKEINPSLLETFSKTLQNLKESKQIIEDKMSEVSSEIVQKYFSEVSVLNEVKRLEVTKIDIEKLQKLSNPEAYIYQLLKEYHFTEWNDVYNLLSAQSGKQIFSETHRLLKDRKFLLLTKIGFLATPEMTVQIDKNTSKITSPIHLEIEEVSKVSIKNRQTIYVDKERLKFPLGVRKWQNGDYFYPSGMKGKKKLSKYFKDEKLSLLEKENIWLLCTNFNEVIWIINKRQDNRFLVNKSTKNYVKISTTTGVL